VSPVPAEFHQEDVAVAVRSRYWLAAVLGLWVAHPLPAAEPARLGVAPDQSLCARPLTANQQIADTIAGRLRQSGVLCRYQIDIIFQDGLAELTGAVADSLQRDEALRIVQSVPGVAKVRDRLILTGPAAVTQTLALSFQSNGQNNGPNNGQGANNGPPMEPMPMFQAAPSAHDQAPPRMPPYAWPTYAPYNNYSRVAYPLLYPYQSWPFIGPCYPFPKVPLGWRSVKLSWEDGFWWYSKTACGHDWWRLRFW
jgi:hypothetical protein